MPCYVIRAGKAGPVKFGHAGTPRIRLQKLQAGHYETLYLLRMFEGGKSEETLLFRRFAHLRLRGEWFHFHPDMLGDVGLIEMRLDTDVEEYREPHARVRARSELQAAIEQQMQSVISLRGQEPLAVARFCSRRDK